MRYMSGSKGYRMNLLLKKKKKTPLLLATHIVIHAAAGKEQNGARTRERGGASGRCGARTRGSTAAGMTPFVSSHK